MRLYNGFNLVQSVTAWNIDGGRIDTVLQPGEYYVRVKPQWGANFTRDYGAVLWSNTSVTLTDQTLNDAYRDTVYA